MLCVSDVCIYFCSLHRVREKGATLLLPLTMPKTNRIKKILSTLCCCCLSTSDLTVNVWQTSYHKSNALLRYLVKCLCWKIVMPQSWVKRTLMQETQPFTTTAVDPKCSSNDVSIILFTYKICLQWPHRKTNRMTDRTHQRRPRRKTSRQNVTVRSKQSTEHMQEQQNNDPSPSHWQWASTN